MTNIIREEIRNDRALRQALERTVEPGSVFATNAGNLGDGLIAMGTFGLLNEYRLTPQVLPSLDADIGDARTLIYGGGGALVEGLYTFAADFIRRFLERGGNVILLPCSVMGFEDIFQRYAGQLEVFVREPYSFARLSGIKGLEGRLHLSHDLAFACDLSPWTSLLHVEPTGVLHCMRTDNESLYGVIPSGNIDIALIGGGHRNWTSRKMCEIALKPVVALFDGFAEVETDRLHMATMAAMMGKRVRMHANLYHKNIGVFEHSLSRFSNVEFTADKTAAQEGDDHRAQARSLDGWAYLKSQVAEFERVKHDWFEPEIARLRNGLEEVERVRDTWYVPEIARLEAELQAALQSDSDGRKAEVARLTMALAEADRLKTQKLLPDIDRLTRSLADAERNATERFETEIQRLTKLFEETERNRILKLEPEIQRLTERLADAKRHADEQLKPEIASLKSSLEDAERNRTGKLEPEIQRLAERLADAERHASQRLEPEIERLRNSLENSERIRREKLEPEIRRLTERLAISERRRVDEFEPDIRRLTMRLKKAERRANDYFRPEMDRLAEDLKTARLRELEQAKHFETKIACLADRVQKAERLRMEMSSRAEKMEAYRRQVLEPQIERLIAERKSMIQAKASTEQKHRQALIFYTQEINYLVGRIDAKQQEISAMQQLKEEWFAPQLKLQEETIAKLTQRLSEFETMKADWWDPEIRRCHDKIAELNQKISYLRSKTDMAADRRSQAVEGELDALKRQLSNFECFGGIVPRLVDELTAARSNSGLTGKLWRVSSGKKQESPAEAAMRPENLKLLLRLTDLFDEEWYSVNNPDVAAGGLEPLEHYTRYGCAEDRAPGPNFDPAAYRLANLDAQASRLPALIHFYLHGLSKPELS